MKKPNLFLSFLGILGPVVAITSTSAVQAQSEAGARMEKLEEIVVTAERRETNVQKTASSITVLGGDDLAREGRVSLVQIVEDVPGITARDSDGIFRAGIDNAGTNVMIRGVGSNAAPGAISAVPATGVYTDGVYSGVGNSYDIERVEVLRGPQGTLYGRSATAGVVSIHTRDPKINEFSADFLGEFGSYSLQHYSVGVNVPLSDVFAVRVAADEYKRDGFYNGEGGALESTNGRIKLLFRPNEDLSVLLGAAFQDNTANTGGQSASLSAPEQFYYVPAPIRESKNNFRQYWAEVNWNLGAATLTYIPALRTWNQNGTLYSVCPCGPGLDQNVSTPFDQFVTNELRLASNAGSKITWLVGAFQYDNRLHTMSVTRLVPTGFLYTSTDSRRQTTDYGIFAELTYPLTDSTRLTAGARYDYTYVESNQTYTQNQNRLRGGSPEILTSLSVSGDAATRRFYNLTEKVRVEHDLASDKLVYAMVSTGFLPGDVQITTVNGLSAVTFDEETLVSYEIGSKNRFLDNRLQLNGSAYYYNYPGYQTRIVPNNLDPSSALYITLPAKMMGGELESSFLLTPNDRLGLSYSYVDAHYKNPPASYRLASAQTHVVGVVPHTIVASYGHTFHLPGDSTLVLRGDGRFLSKHDVGDLTPAQLTQGRRQFVRIGDQVIADLEATWTTGSGKFSATAYVRNVGDNGYPTFVLLGTNVSGIQYDPRRYGIALSLHL